MEKHLPRSPLATPWTWILAVRAARKAFESGAWSKMRPTDRKKLLLAFADRLEAHLGELALLDCLEAGKPIGDCVNGDMPDTVHCIRWHAETIDKLYDRVAPTAADNLALILREPVGVVGAVIPWNFPAQMAAWKIGPALAAGNSVVLKPAEQTSLRRCGWRNWPPRQASCRCVQRGPRFGRNRRAGDRPSSGY